MSLAETVCSMMRNVHQCRPIENGFLVNTHCMYPSNGLVQVFVRGAGSSYVVSDDGGALHEAEAAGAEVKSPERKFAKVLSQQGLRMEHGIIKSDAVPLEYVPTLILAVANMSKEVADMIFQTWRAARSRDFKEMVRDVLRQEFRGISINHEKVIGSSGKPHEFDNVIDLASGRKLIVDPVLHDANSINSRVVANYDVMQAGHAGIKQAIVYDDGEAWQVADLNLLNVSAVSVVGYSKSRVGLRSSTLLA